MPKKSKPVTKTVESTRAGSATWIKGFLLSLSQKANVTLACEEVGVTRQTAYKRRETHPSFAADWDEALEEGADRLESEAWRRASEGVEKFVINKGGVVYHEGAPLKIREYSDTLMALLLRGHKPSKYRERISNELSGKDGAPLQVTVFEIPNNGRD